MAGAAVARRRGPRQPCRRWSGAAAVSRMRAGSGAAPARSRHPAPAPRRRRTAPPPRGPIAAPGRPAAGRRDPPGRRRGAAPGVAPRRCRQARAPEAGQVDRHRAVAAVRVGNPVPFRGHHPGSAGRQLAAPPDPPSRSRSGRRRPRRAPRAAARSPAATAGAAARDSSRWAGRRRGCRGASACDRLRLTSGALRRVTVQAFGRYPSAASGVISLRHRV